MALPIIANALDPRRGLFIGSVVADHPAERAGLHCGEVILGVDHVDVASLAEFRQRLRGRPVVMLTVCGRDRRPRDVRVSTLHAEFAQPLIDEAVKTRLRLTDFQAYPHPERLVVVHASRGPGDPLKRRWGR